MFHTPNNTTVNNHHLGMLFFNLAREIMLSQPKKLTTLLANLKTYFIYLGGYQKRISWSKTI